MSIEYKITELTKAIQLLTDAVNANMAQAAPAPLVQQPVAEEPVAEEPSTPAVEVDAPSVEALQTRCLELTRIDRANSPKIKAIIATYGAAVLKDVPADKLGELAAKLEELA